MDIRDAICAICNCQIKENTLFTGLAEAELEAFKDVVKVCHLIKKEVVFNSGDASDGLYVIRTGRVKLVQVSKEGKEQIIKLAGPGELLGLEGFYDAGSYNTTAIAMDSAELCFISRGDFRKVFKENPGVALKFISSFARELNEAYLRIGSLGLLSAREKLAHLLHSLATSYGERKGSEVRLNLNLSRLEIAELLGITQETSIRLLKGFKDEGILRIEKKEIFITSMEDLAEIGGIE